MGLFDAIIIGAGPAGLACASSLDGKVLLIEKREKPYERIACAEWVPPNFEATTVQETVGMVTVYPGGTVVKAHRGKIIDRRKWQSDILGSLKCEVHLGERALWVEGNKVITDKGRYRANWIVGADGPVSVVRRSLGLSYPPFLPAINVKVPLVSGMKRTMVIFDPVIKKGYGWCFPRGEIANVGVGMEGRLIKGLQFLLDLLASTGIIRKQVLERAVGLIPLGGFASKVVDRKILIGDAGGFIDPLTGAGILYAWDSGKMAARLIKGEISSEEYERLNQHVYGRFLKRRLEKRKIFVEKWENLKEAVEKSWIAFSPA